MNRLFLLSAILSTASAGISLRAAECPLSKATTATSAKITVAPPANIVKTAANAGQFQTLLSLLIAADLDEALKGHGKFTVFAPTDEAFAKLPKGTLETLWKPENQSQLKAILTYHVIPNKESIAFENAVADKAYSFKTLNGSTVKLVKGDGSFRVNDAKIAAKNILCSNGSVQVIDSVLMPPAPSKNTIPVVAEKAGQFKTLLAALTAAELAEVLAGEGPFTVFAPTDDAFAKLPKGTVEKLVQPENRKQLVGILTYHVVTGKRSAKELVKADSVKTLQGETVTITIADGRVTVNSSKF